MSLKQDLGRLRTQLGALVNEGPREETLGELVAWCRRLDDWLASIGQTPHSALALGIEPPRELGLGRLDLQAAAEAIDHANEYRRERGAEPLPQR